MDTNIKLEKNFVYHEAFTDSDNAVKDIARLLAMGVESKEIKDETGTVITPAAPVVDRCWEIIYPKADRILFPEIGDWDNLLPGEYAAVTNHKINKITDTVILKTTTIPKDVDVNNSGSIAVNSDLNKDSVSMYLEIYMPPYLCDSEIEDPFQQRNGNIPNVIDIHSISSTATLPEKVSPSKVARNYHHLFMRIFDNLSSTGDGPAPNVHDPVTRDVIKWNSRSSEWCKLSWYTDFEEYFLADLVGKPEMGSQYGVVKAPISSAGLTSETKIKIWANINKSRVVLGIMGSPNVDFSDNRYLIGCAYIGQIDSFDFSVNDTAGNFGIFTTSSASPAMKKTEIRTRKTERYTDGAGLEGNYPLATIPSTLHTVGAYEFEIMAPDIPPIPYNYSEKDGGTIWGDRYISAGSVKVRFRNDSASAILVDGVSTPLAISDKIEIPAEVIIDPADRRKVKIKVDMKDVVIKSCGSKADSILASTSFSYLRGSSPVSPRLEYSFSIYTEFSEQTGGVKKDKFGNIVKTTFANTYGKNTANGMTDFAMYATFTKDYFQRHQFLIASTEEFMDKELYGKSVYTGEYFADRIKVIHASEGARGILSGLITIDNSSLYPFDELIVNKGFGKYKDQPEELFIYLPITAPTCPFANSANGRHGIGILKDIRYPIPTTDEEIVTFALEQVERQYANIGIVIEDFPLIEVSEYGADITWESSDPTVISVVDSKTEEEVTS